MLAGPALFLARLLGRRVAPAPRPTGPVASAGGPAPAFAWVDVAALQASLALADPPLVLDVRGADEFDGPLGHIPGALNLPLDVLPTRLAELPAGRPIVAVCKTDKRSALAASALSDAGFASVAVLRGGMQQWRGLGL